MNLFEIGNEREGDRDPISKRAYLRQMKLDIYQVDAFSKGAFTGNPAAVVPLDDWLSDVQIQAIAEENNLAETAFYVADGDGFHIRWFTPAVEVALCGHATLATAHVLYIEKGFSDDIIHFNCKSGALSVSKKGGLYTLDFPTDHLERLDSVPEGLKEGLGVSPLEVWRGRDDLLCLLTNEDVVSQLDPDFGILKKLGGRGVLVTAQGNDQFDFVSRGFFPQSGIDEDPATGSAHTSLTPYWSRRLGKNEMTACQLSKRRGYFTCVDKGERTLISGNTSLYLKGQIYI